MTNMGHAMVRASRGALFAAALVCVQMATAAPVAEATTSLTGFGYQVTDLDNADGVAAGIQFNQKDGRGTALWLVDNEFHLPGGGAAYSTSLVGGSPFDPATVVHTHGGIDGEVSKRGTDLAARATYTSTEAVQLLSRPYPPDNSSNPYRLAFSRRAFAWPQSEFFDLPFTVAPHTSVTFTAHLNLAADVDVASILGSDAVLRHTDHGKLVDVRATGRSFLRITDPDQGYWEGPSLDYAGRGASKQAIIESNGRVTYDTSGDPVGSYLLEVSFTNHSDKAVERALGFVMEAETTIYVQTVPENDALTLMAVGLGAVALVQRRRFAKKVA